ncbi:MAG: hypothetical protein IIC95_11720 [Chloroflexi bacterium]|nr:hypothetical protein [Chloroflexota bacterium]
MRWLAGDAAGGYMYLVFQDPPATLNIVGLGSDGWASNPELYARAVILLAAVDLTADTAKQLVNGFVDELSRTEEVHCIYEDYTFRAVGQGSGFLRLQSLSINALSAPPLDGAPATATCKPLPAAPEWQTPTPSPTPDHALELESFRCYKETFGDFGFAYVEGRVTNISGRTLENVTAVAQWFTPAEEFITSDTALIQFNPLLPGQTSPFKTITTLNPAMESCSISFQTLFGAGLSTRSKMQ